ncbi:hypothetical protein AWY96_00130 [Serratia plymuthica]|uniref:hypothetical protein n=1 Tax=Serratia plymuthica TaxID=82996 RepID=UPI0007A00BFB|nr:hypothetical protein [Serratia plymuthica]KYQ96989.1 hypothetical protein AWY96_00130 [Serratia plymuthica]
MDKITELKKQFGAWKVPSDEHFHALIDLAALTFKPGQGLSGGDPSKCDGVVAIEQTTALAVKTHHGMDATTEGVSVKPNLAGGLAVGATGLYVKMSTSVIFDGLGLYLKVNESKALKVKSGSIAVQIANHKGLKPNDDTSSDVSLSVDSKTVEIDENGALRVKYDRTGGLTIDKDGYLGVDLDIILVRPCIRAYQGWAYAYIPKDMIEDRDKVLLYIHDMYVGEILHAGAASYVTVTNREEATKYWIAQLAQWVTENDVLRARLIKKGQDEGTGTDIARHTVTPAGSAPASIPRITGVRIVNASGTVQDTVGVEDTLYVIHDTYTKALIYSWKIKNLKNNEWVNFPENNTATYKIPADIPPGSQICVLLVPNENKGPLAFSNIVTVKKL